MPLSEQQLDENREIWNARILGAFREYFGVYGDRRDDRAEKLAMIATYGEDAAAIMCQCGKIVTWAEWPKHWRAHANAK